MEVFSGEEKKQKYANQVFNENKYNICLIFANKI